MAPHDTFPQRVWHIVASIPEGYVTTYGEVAGWQVHRARRARWAAY
ncbi:putative methyltransferase [Klebsiella pneumoniae]|uniref:Putative methyltransferase n=1 Tax=Klebsiella pneumoniae TaxID=573 RepID=A0A378ASW0_KLEPN|nr:putative methyltransferase [Klebsiella pneumoniae]